MFIVYETTNIKNGKYYRGVHRNNDIDNDHYLGSGKILKEAIRKYGKESFSRTILFITECKKEAFDFEKNIVVTNDKDPLSYNIASGGSGGWYHIWNNEEYSARRSENTLKSLRGKPKSKSHINNLKGKRPHVNQNGGHNNNAKKITTPLGNFDSVMDASHVLDITYGAILHRLGSPLEKWKEWNFINGA